MVLVVAFGFLASNVQCECSNCERIINEYCCATAWNGRCCEYPINRNVVFRSSDMRGRRKSYRPNYKTQTRTRNGFYSNQIGDTLTDGDDFEVPLSFGVPMKRSWPWLQMNRFKWISRTCTITFKSFDITLDIVHSICNLHFVEKTQDFS